MVLIFFYHGREKYLNLLGVQLRELRTLYLMSTHLILVLLSMVSLVSLTPLNELILIALLSQTSFSGCKFENIGTLGVQ